MTGSEQEDQRREAGARRFEKMTRKYRQRVTPQFPGGHQRYAMTVAPCGRAPTARATKISFKAIRIATSG